MKVVAFNGSPKKEGNTYHSIKLITDELEKEGIETEIVCVGNNKIRGCTGCGQCAKMQNEKCIFDDDIVNELVQKMKEADGIIISSPVYFAGINGTMKSFLDRAFYVSMSNGNLLRHKVGVSIAAVRRSGGIPTVNQLNQYINYSEMIVPTSNYWNVIHGASPGEVLKDGEGVQIMKTLGKNMAFTMKIVKEGKKRINPPKKVKKTRTNFIR